MLSKTRITGLQWQEAVKVLVDSDIRILFDQDIYGALKLYTLENIHPGGFLFSVLCNDLEGAISKAHRNFTMEAFKDLITFINMVLPAHSWGTYEKVNEWLDEDQREQ